MSVEYLFLTHRSPDEDSRENVLNEVGVILYQ